MNGATLMTFDERSGEDGSAFLREFLSLRAVRFGRVLIGIGYRSAKRGGAGPVGNDRWGYAVGIAG